MKKPAIICVIEVGATGVLQNNTCFFGDKEGDVVDAAEEYFKKRCAEKFGLEWIRLSDEEKNGCIVNGFFECDKFVENVASVTQILINWPTRKLVS